ncbi:MAG: universal stress protein [Mycobacterium sp.]|nr:universal stress protein [Mycobacterium sp.]
MSSKQTQYAIPVAVDGSPESDTAVSWAAREAALRKAGVALLHVNAPILVTWPISTAESAVAECQNDSSRQMLEHATVRRTGSSLNLSTRSWSSSEAAAAAGSPVCC